MGLRKPIPLPPVRPQNQKKEKGAGELITGMIQSLWLLDGLNPAHPGILLDQKKRTRRMSAS